MNSIIEDKLVTSYGTGTLLIDRDTKVQKIGEVLGIMVRTIGKK
jgi:hypothetical protein